MDDARELFEIEASIHQNHAAIEALEAAKKAHWILIAQDVRHIKDDHKYRQAGFAEFKNYCEAGRLPFNYTHAMRLILAEEVDLDLEQLNRTADLESPIGDSYVTPRSETHLRPLTPIQSPEKRRKIWKRVIETAPKGKITQKHVQKIVDDFYQRDHWDEALNATLVKVLQLKLGVEEKGGPEGLWQTWTYDRKERWTQDISKMEGILTVMGEEFRGALPRQQLSIVKEAK